MKKLSLVLAACMLTSAIAAPTGVQAIFVENSQPGTLEEIIKALGDDTLSIYDSNVYTRDAYAFTSSGKCYHYSEMYCGSPVKVSDGTELPVDEINQKIEQYKAKLEYSPENGYTVRASIIQNRPDVYKILQSYKQVLSIDEQYKVYTSVLWTCEGVVIDSDKTNDEIISEYPELGLSYDESSTGDYTDLSKKYPEYQCYKKYSNVRVFRLKTSINEQTFNSEYYTALKKLADNEKIFMTTMIADMDSVEDVPVKTVNVYTAPQTGTPSSDSFMYGDLDDSKVVDLTDLIMLSQYLLGDREFNDIQKLAADVQYDGVINISDLPRMKQFIVHDKVTLGKPQTIPSDSTAPSNNENNSNIISFTQSVSDDPVLEGTKFIALQTGSYTNEFFSSSEQYKNVVIKSLDEFEKYNTMTEHNDLDKISKSLNLSDEFFKDNVIFMTIKFEPSISIKNSITSASISEKGFTMNADTYIPALQDCAVAQWYLVSAVPVSDLNGVDTSDFMTVFNKQEEKLPE